MTDPQQVLATVTVIAFHNNNKNMAFLCNTNSIS